jgi:cytochrome c biogenesis protein
MTATTELATSPEDRAPLPRRPGLLLSLRRSWRTLVSMRTALLLLFLLAVAAIPGSLLPQRTINPAAVGRWYDTHPSLAPVLDRLYAFDVYASPWFAAIYLLLMVSLVGCLLPRWRLHVRALRSRPPLPPAHLSRLPLYSSFTVPSASLDRVRLRGWRVRREASGLGAERGYARETGNLLFHVALLGLLVGIAIGAAWGYKGDVLVVEGDTFVNTPAAYDTLTPGRLNSADHLPPFEVTVDDFRATYLPSGQPASFAVDVRYTGGHHKTIKVNDPLTIRGNRVYLLDHGYALHFVARRGGDVVYDQWQPFLPDPSASNLVSDGAVKITDLGGGLPDVGLRGRFVPTYARSGRTAFSASPEPLIPAFVYDAYAGDAGLGTGEPQSVYDLDTSRMVRTGQGTVFAGQSVDGLAGGVTLEFEGVKDFVVLHVTNDPGKRLVLVSAICALLGLILSLRVRRRRLWVRLVPGDAGTLVEVGGLARQDPAGYEPEFARVVARLRATFEESP